MRNTSNERRKISLPKDLKIKKRFEEKVIEFVDIGAPNVWGHFKDGIVKTCDELCEKRGRRSKGDIWWWNEEVKEEIS